jgi:hypothetical protein
MAMLQPISRTREFRYLGTSPFLSEEHSAGAPTSLPSKSRGWRASALPQLTSGCITLTVPASQSDDDDRVRGGGPDIVGPDLCRF